MIKIKVIDWYNLYRKHTFEFHEGITCLIGRNGAGKSTLLHTLKEFFKKNNIPFFYYDNEYSEKHAMSSFDFLRKTRINC